MCEIYSVLGQGQKHRGNFRGLLKFLEIKVAWSEVTVMELVRNGKILNIF